MIPYTQLRPGTHKYTAMSPVPYHELDRTIEGELKNIHLPARQLNDALACNHPLSRCSARATGFFSPGKLSKPLAASFRSIVEKQKAAGRYTDIENALIFMKSQRIHKVLLERYNPTGNYTAKERLEATTRRVGLQLPKSYDPSTES
ncbi:hypothetical protein K438DRAFT_794023 [Mycena galopus ATCC 62051]|nr:hypothetical protein K438DRAFT_794023 [Mycena galopus ATCC 62051]